MFTLDTMTYNMKWVMEFLLLVIFFSPGFFYFTFPEIFRKGLKSYTLIHFFKLYMRVYIMERPQA